MSLTYNQSWENLTIICTLQKEVLLSLGVRRKIEASKGTGEERISAMSVLSHRTKPWSVDRLVSSGLQAHLSFSQLSSLEWQCLVIFATDPLPWGEGTTQPDWFPLRASNEVCPGLFKNGICFERVTDLLCVHDVCSCMWATTKVWRSEERLVGDDSLLLLQGIKLRSSSLEAGALTQPAIISMGLKWSDHGHLREVPEGGREWVEFCCSGPSHPLFRKNRGAMLYYEASLNRPKPCLLVLVDIKLPRS